MLLKRAALKLGLQLIQYKLGRAAGDPSFSAITADDPAAELQAELPTTKEQLRDRSAKIKAPRVITTG
jgi:hypothetical protein